MNERMNDITGKLDAALREFVHELIRAEQKHPHWPSDQIHAVAIMVEEAGEALQAAIDYEYGKTSASDVELLVRLRSEIIQTGAMALRALMHLDEYGYQGKGIS